MGYLEELKRQADAALAQQTQDIGALQRNALLTDSACQTTSRYFGTLARQLNVLQPVSKAVWRFDNRTSFSQLRFTDFRADSRLKKLRDEEVFDHVVLNFAAKTGTRVTIAWADTELSSGTTIAAVPTTAAIRRSLRTPCSENGRPA